MNTPKDNQSQAQENECSDIWTYLAESADSPWLPSNLGEYRQLSLLKSTPMHSEFSDTTSQISPSTQTSETITQSQESLKSSQWDGRVQAQVTQEVSKDSNIQPHHSGEKDLDVSLKLNPSSVLWNSLKDLSDEDLELFLPPSIWQDTLLKLKQSRQQALVLGNRGTDCLSFPTLTSNECFTSRPAGQTKCEKWFKDNGLVPSGSQLSAQAIALIMGFPPNWFDCLSQVKPQEELEVDISQVEQLHQHKQPLPSEEFSISIPCLVKQPKQPELKGVIRKDLGDHFSVYIPDSDSTITVSKLFVYPDFSESVGQIEKNPSKNSSPSTKSQNQTRRRKGEGSGSIYYRTVIRNGKEYQQAYYHYKLNGKKRTKYIPQKLLGLIQSAENQKRSVAEIVDLLGEKNINPSKSSSTSVDEKVKINDEVIENCEISPSKIKSPSKNQRRRGEGSGSIHCKPIKRSGKEYKQYWYHWEIWRSGDRLIKKSRYIPKRLLVRVEKMEAEKRPVREILELLGVYG